MHQDKRLVAAFVHACWLLRSSRAESLDMLHVPVESDKEVESDELLEVPLSSLKVTWRNFIRCVVWA